MAKPAGSIVVVEGKLRFDYDNGAYIEDSEGRGQTLHNMVGMMPVFGLHAISKRHYRCPSSEPIVRVTVEVLAD